MQNPFELILDRLEAIQDRVGRIDTVIQRASYTSQYLHLPKPKSEKEIVRKSKKQEATNAKY